MNKIYKVIWSKIRSCYVVTSEFGKNRIKAARTRSVAKAAVAAALALTASLGCTGFAGAAYNVTVGSDGKLPSGTPVVAGDAGDLLTKNDANTTYLSKADAGTTYLSKADAGTTYLSKADANTNFATKTDLQDEKNERVAADKALSDRIDKQEEKTTNISYNAGGGTNVDGVNIKNGAMSGVTKLNDISVNGNALSGISTLETTGDATIGGDLTVKGTFKPSEVLVKDDNNNLTHIKPGDIESKNLNFTGDIHNNTVEGSRFKFDKTGLDASAVGMGPTGGNGAQLKLQKDKITQEVVDSNSNSNLLEQTATGSVHTVTNGTDSTKIEQTATDVNVTAESGNINNKAKNITNTTSEDMTNTIGKNLTTTVGGNQTTDVTGDQSNTVGGKLTETVTGDVTEDYKANQSTTVGGNQTTHVKGNQANTVDGTLTETVTGDVTEDYKANQTTTVAKDQTTTVGGNQTTHVKGNQANTVDGTLTETVTGDVTEDYKANQSTTVGGNQSTTVTGDAALTAANITQTAGTKLVNTVGTTSMTMTADGTTFAGDVNMKDNLNVAKNGTFGGSVTAASYMIGTRTYIDGNGLHANGQKITDVAPGALNESSMDAVNGAQLYQTNQRMNLWNRDLSRVGAGAAALAGLHPVGYDETAKLSFAVGFGSYKSEHAAALGAYYRPNDNVLFGISSTVGYGDNMYNASLSFKFGQGSHERGISKAAQQKIDTLQNRVDILESRLNSLLSMFNPNMAKDFPDVPENHWAYEAISRLAGNGIIEGYPDGEYHGERTMTRYEMATIIYNALKRGVQADANLVREFQPELSMIESSR